MKRIFSLIAILVLMGMCLVGCGSDDYDYDTDNGYNYNDDTRYDHNGNGKYDFSDYVKDEDPDLYNDMKDRYDSLK